MNTNCDCRGCKATGQGRSLLAHVVHHSDPIDIIATGRRLIDVHVDFDGNPSNDWDVQCCMFHGCCEDVYLRPDEHDDAFRLYMWRDNDEDEILFVCRDHVQHISNWPAIVGHVDIREALDLVSVR